MKIKITNLTPESAKKRSVPIRKEKRLPAEKVLKSSSYKETIITSILALIVFFIIILNANAYNKEVRIANWFVKTKSIHAIDVKTTINTYNGRTQLVTAYKEQIATMKRKGYSDTRILDLLALKSMECNRYDGLCYWHYKLDVWPFQINRIHKDAYVTSFKLISSNQLAWLFDFQLKYANKLVSSYMDRYCGRHIFKLIWRNYSNERRFKCVAVTYNWHPRYKRTYAILAWKKREAIKNLIYK